MGILKKLKSDLLCRCFLVLFIFIEKREEKRDIGYIFLVNEWLNRLFGRG